MMRILLIGLLLSGCASAPEVQPAVDLGTLLSMECRKTGWFRDSTVVVHFYDEGRTLVTIEDYFGDYSSGDLSRTANELKKISMEGLPTTREGTVRPMTDLGVVTIVWHGTKGDYVVQRDFRMEGRFEGKFYKLNAIFVKLADQLGQMRQPPPEEERPLQALPEAAGPPEPLPGTPPARTGWSGPQG